MSYNQSVTFDKESMIDLSVKTQIAITNARILLDVIEEVSTQIQLDCDAFEKTPPGLYNLLKKWFCGSRIDFERRSDLGSLKCRASDIKTHLRSIISIQKTISVAPSQIIMQQFDVNKIVEFADEQILRANSARIFSLPYSSAGLELVNKRLNELSIYYDN